MLPIQSVLYENEPRQNVLYENVLYKMLLIPSAWIGLKCLCSLAVNKCYLYVYWMIDNS